MSVIEKIKELAALIRGATQPAENDANRVGLTFEKIGDELEALDTKIDTETSNRTTAISNEKAARETADASLQQAISNEKAARETADTTEKNARQTADASLQQAISNEKAARETADTTEKDARQTADASLLQAISNEKAARETADTTEKDARQAADASLQQAISNEEAARETALRSFYTAAGAVYNATTGYYELNGLTDITEAQMAEIYAIGRGFNFGKDNDFKFAYQRLRTNLLPITSGSLNCGVYTVYSANNAVSCRCMFGYTGTFEIVVVGIGKTGTEMGFYPLDASSMFVNCSNLRTVLGVLKMKYCNSVSGMFTGCSSLRTIKLSEVKINNISFADSPLLYYSSLKYLVDNAANTAAITVTVHADVYAKLTRTYEGSVISLIGDEAAETGQDVMTLAGYWNKLPAAAAEKNISFAES